MKTMCFQEFIYLIMRLYCHFSQVPISENWLNQTKRREEIEIINNVKLFASEPWRRTESKQAAVLTKKL